MIWKCQVTCVIGEGEKGEIVSRERHANNPVVGMQLAFQDLMELVSTLDYRRTAAPASMQLLGWADAVVDPDRGSDALRSQRMLDRARSNELSIDPCAADNHEPH